ncbi:hypothetical protein AB0K43_13000 [Kitasatospora sp. NPDC049258]|uniref:hypothetical protein n=1 Tax=Kitasatospora sp. NPDC049258 TaxID=3155394 RepID=UPI003429F7C7
MGGALPRGVALDACRSVMYGKQTVLPRTISAVEFEGSRSNTRSPHRDRDGRAGETTGPSVADTPRRIDTEAVRSPFTQGVVSITLSR